MPLDDDDDDDDHDVCVCARARVRACVCVLIPTVLLIGWLGADNFIVGGIGPRIHE